jgi:hypothetical protein
MVHRVHLTQREPVVKALRIPHHPTIHDSQATPRKCEDDCDREVDDYLAC